MYRASAGPDAPPDSEHMGIVSAIEGHDTLAGALPGGARHLLGGAADTGGGALDPGIARGEQVDEPVAQPVALVVDGLVGLFQQPVRPGQSAGESLDGARVVPERPVDRGAGAPFDVENPQESVESSMQLLNAV